MLDPALRSPLHIPQLASELQAVAQPCQKYVLTIYPPWEHFCLEIP